MDNNTIKNLNINGDASLIMGYILDWERFTPIFRNANKGRRAWKAPTYLKSLINNPSTLFSNEHWLYDSKATTAAFESLKQEKFKGADKLEFIFNEAPNIEEIDLQSALAEEEDVATMLDTMNECDNNEFREVINPLADKYGWYANPNNFDFERMNAGVARALLIKYPNICPTDDLLRSPVYEYVNSENIEQENEQENEQILKELLDKVSRNILPLPKFDSNWDTANLLEKLNSKEAKQLRELISTINQDSDTDTTQLIKEAEERSKFISPTKEITKAVGDVVTRSLISMGATITSIPIFYLPTYYLLGQSVYDLVEKVDMVRLKPKMKWLGLLEYLATLDKKENDA